MASDYLDKLAEFVTGTRLEDLSNSTIMAAKTVVLDTLGAILGSMVCALIVQPIRTLTALSAGVTQRR
jgi:2-methylcitrate dehydratase PrpD